MSYVSVAPAYRFSVAQYHRLGEVGILGEDDRVELLNGEIVLMAPKGIRHIKAIRRLIRHFYRCFGERCLVDAQNPVLLNGYSETVPDFLLLRAEADLRDSAPLPEDVFLLVEVADTSLVYDQTDKRSAYARNGIVEYWILDLTRDLLHVFRDTDGREYRTELTVRPDESIAPLAFADTPVALKDLLP